MDVGVKGFDEEEWLEVVFMFLENVNLFWLGERVGIVGDRICLVVIDFEWFFL